MNRFLKADSNLRVILNPKSLGLYLAALEFIILYLSKKSTPKNKSTNRPQELALLFE